MIDRIAHAAAVILLFLSLAAVLVPVDPSMPAASLDGAWVLALNTAVSHKMVFGKDLVFTFGPYASVYTGAYHPQTDTLMMLGSIYFCSMLALLLILLAGKTGTAWALLFSLVVTVTSSLDSLFYCYPLAATVVFYRITLPPDHPQRIKLPGPMPIALALLVAPLGLLPLVKVSLLFSCGVSAAALAVFLFLRHDRRGAAVVLLTPTLFAIVLWCVAGQPFLALPRFILATLPIVSGYTEAMALEPKRFNTLCFLAAALVIAATLLFRGELPRAARALLMFAFGLFLFVCFKAGFVREDAHVAIASAGLVLACMLLSTLLGSRAIAGAMIVSVFCWGAVDLSYEKTNVQKVAAEYNRLLNGIQVRSAKGVLAHRFGESLQAIREAVPIPKGTGTVDIYSAEQEFVLASEARWAPRPMLQSYAAYSPHLAELDRAHLIGPDAPDTILFKMFTIDNRLASMDDGPSWPELLRRYRFDRVDHGFVWLKRRGEALPEPAVISKETSTHRFGEKLQLAASASQLTYARIFFHPTLIGSLISFFYKPTILEIHLELLDGRRVIRRLISGMTRSTFLLSPFVDETGDLPGLLGEPNRLGRNLLESFTLLPGKGGALYWKNEYELELTNVALPPGAKLEVQAQSSVEMRKPDRTLNCEGVVDYINGVPPPSADLRGARALLLSGWMPVSQAEGTVPDTVYATLTDAASRTFYWRATSTPRKDVKAYLKHPEMPDLGFEAFIDLAPVADGDYTIGIAWSKGDLLDSCLQYKFPVHVAH